jgi:uncharacterized membrane protein
MIITKIEIVLQRELPWRLAAVLVLILAAGLRLMDFDGRPLWFDEAIEYWMANVPLSDIHLAVANATHDPPFFSYLAHVWMRAGITEFWLRLPSLFASLLSIAGVIHLGRYTTNRLTGLVAGLLLAIGAADIRYAQEFGQYALLVMLITWNLIFLYQAHREGEWRWWLLWGGTAVISIYTHYGSVIAVGTAAAAFLVYHLWQRKWTAVIWQLATSFLVLLSLTPLVLVVIPNQMGRLGATPQPFSLAALYSVSWQILAFQLIANDGFLYWPWSPLPVWVVAIPLLLAIAVALLKVRSWLAPPALLILTWLAYFLISRTGAYFMGGTRHSLLLVPLLAVTVATGMVIIARRNGAVAAVLVTAVALITLLIPRERAEDLRTITHFWLAQQQPGDQTYVYATAAPGFRYQLDVAASTPSVLPPYWYRYCRADENVPAYCWENGIYYGRWLRNLPIEVVQADLEPLLQQVPTRLWLIFAHTNLDEHNRFLQLLQADYKLSDQVVQEGQAAYLLTTR